MKHPSSYFLFVLLIFISLFFTGAAFGKTPENQEVKPQRLNNIALCYHGFTVNEEDKSEYVTYLEDFKEQINYLKDQGYKFVSPSKYREEYKKRCSPDTPLAAVFFDDARDSVLIAARWLSANDIPFGIAVIGKRLGTIYPEDGYMSWSDLKGIFDTGYCEILSHTYNMHHFGLIKENGTIESAPILEGPTYIDDGDFIYMKNNDPRWYWDLTHVDGITWSFPLFGTDLKNGQPIISKIKFKAKESLSINKMRLWACLHSPYSSGYDAAVKVDIDGTQVAAKTISPIQYETRRQWPEREYVTIEFDRAYTLEANKTYTITFTTLNSGDSSFNIYAIPDFSGDYELVTTGTGMSYKAYQRWPARAGIILTGDNGREAAIREFRQYVLDDLSINSDVIDKYLGASWNTYTNGYEEDDHLECLVLGGTYSDGSLANTKIKFVSDRSFIGEVLRFKTTAHIGDWYPLIIDVYINDQKVSRFSSNWQDWKWQTVDIIPYKFIEGQEYNITFKTVNKSPNGSGLVRIYMDQRDLPWPTWNPGDNTWNKPDNIQFQYEPQYEVSSSEGTDIYPEKVSIDNLDFAWEYSSPYTGPGKAFIEILSCNPGTSVRPTQVCYPFGSYHPKKEGNQHDISPQLKNIFKQLGISSGMAVWDEPVRSLKNIEAEYSEYVIPRYLVHGNIGQSQILQDINILIGLN